MAKVGLVILSNALVGEEFGFGGEPIVEERKNSFNCNSTGGHFDICAGILPSEMLCLKGYLSPTKTKKTILKKKL